ncbi:hypothetical protein HNE04_27680 [Caenimonas sp. S4]|nr:hypothetical protein [Caenimonas soli]
MAAVLPTPAFACHQYGCADCSCVTNVTEKQSHEQLAETMTEIKRVLEAKGIAPETVQITIKAQKKGPKSKGQIRLTDNSIAGFSCFNGCVCCSWTFKKPEVAK